MKNPSFNVLVGFPYIYIKLVCKTLPKVICEFIYSDLNLVPGFVCTTTKVTSTSSYKGDLKVIISCDK